MTIEIKVIPNARKNEIKEENGKYKIYLNAPAVDGKANKKLIEFLAEHYKIRKSSIFIKRGEKSRHKIIQINE
ncbi:MAG TPA: hypothetical protein DCP53_06910 [Elusimicrobia bacterium]|nr:MAG: hypothetical protein A2551_01660 [Elusimicrobia bacterium RIFOXYD2_FULL_34_30]HAM39104.1 hypothetical protein [Elusimicrobiota bacterium]